MVSFQVWVTDEDRNPSKEYDGPSLTNAISSAWKFCGDYNPEIRVMDGLIVRETLAREAFDRDYKRPWS
jgi:hypothetical protein